MSVTIAVMGQSGHGKTTAMRALDPSTTYYIDADKKGLSWRGWAEQYSETKNNYRKTSDAFEILDLLKSLNTKTSKIQTIVIDTANAIMIDEEMSRMKEKGFDKWVDLAQSIYDLISYCNEMRKGLIVIWNFHVEILSNEEEGTHFARFATSGRKLQKIYLEAKFSIVLYAKAKDGEYIFETQANNSCAKSPMGLFADMEIPNDMKYVVEKVAEYGGEEASNISEPGVDLINKMADDGIPNYLLIEYCIEKGWLKDGNVIADIRPDLIEAMLKTANWEKVRKAIATKASGIDDADISDAAKGLRVMMDLTGTPRTDVETYMVKKKWIKKGKRWHTAKDDLLEAMSVEKNWDKILKTMKG